MTGGTLIVSREVNLLQHYKERLEALGYKNVAYTANDKDGLNMVINELKPKTVFVEADFYDSATPYMMSLLVKRFKRISFVVVSMSRYPPDRGMCFIINGVKSFLYYPDGIEQFYRGLECVRDGNIFISPSVQERFEIRDDLPRPAVELTEKEIEVARLVCNAYTGPEIADTLHLSLRTVNFHKRELYTNLSIRNENELIRVMQYLGIVKQNELNFYGRNYELSPMSCKKKEDRKMKRAKKNEQKAKIRRIYDYKN